MRCKVQNKVIDEVHREMLESPVGTLAVLPTDYSMKYETKKYQQKSFYWYGRKRIGWHGTVVTFKAGVERRTVQSGNHGRGFEADIQLRSTNSMIIYTGTQANKAPLLSHQSSNPLLATFKLKIQRLEWLCSGRITLLTTTTECLP